MTVSDKMGNAAGRCAYHGIEGNDAAQAVINAAWTRFDPEDESTHPKTSLAPSGMPWLIEEHEHGAENPRIGCDEWFCNDKDWLLSFDVQRYADPTHLMPETET